MNAKKFLLQIKKAEYLIQNKQAQIDDLRRLLNYKGTSYDNPGVQGGKHLTEADMICKIIDFENELNTEIDKLIDLKREVMSIVDQLENPDLIDIIYKRYLRFEIWEKIAVDEGISIRQVYRKHGEALAKIQKILDDVI